MMQDHEIIEKIKEYFEDNYERMRLEGGHAITEDIKTLALNQVLFYFQKMRDVATRVTETEVKLTLPDQRTPKGRNFTIEGIVDIVREDDETWMYDIKTHDPDYVESNKEFYQDQLNVYAFIWQQLRGEPLDHTAIISTAYPTGLRRALQASDAFAIQYELAKWKPLIEIPFAQEDVKGTVTEFGETVDKIEDKEFKPAPLGKLKSTLEGTKALFATRVCRNCDARFSCSSYRAYAQEAPGKTRTIMKQFFDDYGSDVDQEDWINANLQATNDNLINGARADN